MCLLELTACGKPGRLPVQFAIESIHMEKGGSKLALSVEISTVANLVEELEKIDSVTAGHLICPLEAKDVYYLEKDSDAALIAPVHVILLPKNGGVKSVKDGKYHYQLDGQFENGNSKSAGLPLSAMDVVPLLKKREALACKIVVLRYFRAPYFSNTVLLKTADLMTVLGAGR